MCGICGMWDPAGIDSDALSRMNATLTHRGPDDQGQIDLKETGLAARRLSIIDLHRGHQPIQNEDGTAWIAFNGEIYNYQELRRGLETRGHRFRTESDTEVILHLYEEEQERVVDRLRGMFAFAIWDVAKRKLFLARDRFGQKPLFYAWQGSRFLFGSEIKAVVAGMDTTPALNLDALDDYLTLRFVPSPDTLFEGVRKIPPGHTLVIDSPAIGTDNKGGAPPAEVRRYWNLRYRPKQSMTERAAIEELDERLRETVERHLVSDVPVGAFLSGGMDSSLIVAMMARAMDAPVSTFAIGVEEADFNELPFAAEVSRHCGTNHHAELASPDLVRLLPTMIHHLDEPSDPIAACMFHASALAARHAKVVLTGDGGDEMFAGFDRYAGYRWVKLYAALPSGLRRLVLGPALGRLRDTAGYKTITQKARWLHELSFYERGRRYAQATVFFRFGANGKGGLYGPRTASRLAGRDATDCIVEAFDSAEAEDDLDRMLSTDIDTRLPEHSLMLSDRMTMSQSIEGRSPFLDHELAEFVATLPVGFKLKGGRLKYIMRRVSERYLPRSILDRPKQGFMFPLGYWMKGPLAPVMKSLTDRSLLVEAGIFRQEALSGLLHEHLSDRADHHVRLWMILNAELWYRMYIAGQSGDELAALLAKPDGRVTRTGEPMA